MQYIYTFRIFYGYRLEFECEDFFNLGLYHVGFDRNFFFIVSQNVIFDHQYTSIFKDMKKCFHRSIVTNGLTT